MRRWLAVLALAALSRGQEPAPIDALIARLGHDAASERVAAASRLRGLGGRAEVPLAKAEREHADPEVRRRAGFLLRSIRTGWPKQIEPTPGRRVELSDAPQNGLARLSLSSDDPGDAWIEYEMSLSRGGRGCCLASGTIPARRGGETARFGPLLPGDQIRVRARFLDAGMEFRHVSTVEHDVGEEP